LIQRFKENRMRKFLVGSLLFAAAGGGVVLSGAASSFATGPTEQCNTAVPAPTNALGTTSVLAPSGPNTSGELQVCEDGSPIVDGTATAEGNANPPGGYAVADGSGAPGHATGYIGVEGGTGGADVVGCSQGDYNNGTNSNTDGPNNTSGPGPNDGAGTTDANGNNIIVGTDGNSLAETATGPCSVTNEPAP
jgi:hypothetical protein